MAITNWAITRQPNDLLAETRISIGSLPNEQGAYITFRGDPEQVVNVLKQALVKAMEDLPQGNYQDQRGRPQG